MVALILLEAITSYRYPAPVMMASYMQAAQIPK